MPDLKTQHQLGHILAKKKIFLKTNVCLMDPLAQAGQPARNVSHEHRPSTRF